MTQGFVLCMGIKGRLRIEKEQWRLKTISAQTAKTKEVETFFIPNFTKFITTDCFTNAVRWSRCWSASP